MTQKLRRIKMSIITASNVAMMIAYACIFLLDNILIVLELHRRGFIVGWKNLPLYERIQFIVFCILIGLIPFINVAFSIFVFIFMKEIIDDITK